jgi:hypothetical protein
MTGRAMAFTIVLCIPVVLGVMGLLLACFGGIG